MIIMITICNGRYADNIHMDEIDNSLGQERDNSHGQERDQILQCYIIISGILYTLVREQEESYGNNNGIESQQKEEITKSKSC